MRPLLTVIAGLLMIQFCRAQDSLTVNDTRSNATNPGSYNRSMTPSFKNASVVGVPTTVGTYTTVIGIRGWSDNTGGKAQELAFTDDNNIYVRSGAAPTWEAWRKIITENDNGNVGIGTIGPDTKLKVVQTNTFAENDETTYGIALAQNGSSVAFGGSSTYSVIQSFNSHPLYLNPLSNNVILSGNGLGNVGIGTYNPQSLLAVNGTVTAKGVSVTLNGWSDYVFEPEYKLRPLQDVENYIRLHHHLPDVPSAKDVENEGLDLGSIAKQQMQKIEELTLYVIEADKRVARDEALIAHQQEMLQQLDAKMEALRVQVERGKQ